MNTVAIDQLNTEEKIFTMEKIWDDLCHQAGVMQSPDWHKSILESRLKVAESGNAEYSDWTEAKSRIRNSTS
jgi:hypothetical protein